MFGFNRTISALSSAMTRSVFAMPAESPLKTANTGGANRVRVDHDRPGTCERSSGAEKTEPRHDGTTPYRTRMPASCRCGLQTVPTATQVSRARGLTHLAHWRGPSWIGHRVRRVLGDAFAGGRIILREAVGDQGRVHLTVAVVTDVLLVLHIYLNLVWPGLRDAIRGARYYFELQHRRRVVVPLQTR
jgi:hypothetical protein